MGNWKNTATFRGEKPKAGGKKLMFTPPYIVPLAEIDEWSKLIIKGELDKDKAMQLYLNVAIYSWMVNRFCEEFALQVGAEKVREILGQFGDQAVAVVTKEIYEKLGAESVLKH